MKPKWLKLSHHKHSGRLRAHEYTSYLPLAALLVVVGVALTAFTAYASPGPQAGSIGLTGEMPGPAPKVAATIDSPITQQHLITSPTTVTGTCPTGTLVEIYKNDIFAGSTPCTSKGTYSLDIDLLFGQNRLVAKVYDALNQPGPDSNVVVVNYDVTPPKGAVSSLLNFSDQLILNTNAVYRGTFPGQTLTIPISLIGGTPPYAISTLWGDSKSSVVSRNNTLSFNVSHVYDKPGTYQITVQASDTQGRKAFLTVAAIINGQPSITTVATTSKPTHTNQLLMLWPLYTFAVTMVISFWLGERREKHILGGPGMRLHPQH